jgi:hypothetical protein
MHLRIRAILSLTGVCKAPEAVATQVVSAADCAGTFLPGFSCVMVDVLGRSLLDRTLDRLTSATDTQAMVIVEVSPVAGVFPCDDATATGSVHVWEAALARQLMCGVDHLLLMRLNAYTDLDFRELIRSHVDTQSSLTRVYGLAGALDIAIVSATSLQGVGTIYCNRLSKRVLRERQFLYTGYLNSLASPRQLRQLVEDGLSGICCLNPVGIEVRPGIWYGAGARVDSSATIEAPAFVGRGSHISSFCTIDRASAIEHGCVIDYKSDIRQSWLLQNTHVGIGLNVRHAIVFNNRLVHLDRGVVVNCDPRLIGTTSISAALAWSLRHRERFQERVASATNKLPGSASVDTVTSEPKLA